MQIETIKKLATRPQYSLMTFSVLILAGLMQVAVAAPGDRDIAKRIHDRLAGIPPTEAVLDTMESCFSADTTACDVAVSGLTASSDPAIKAAYIAMENSAFYNVTLKNFAAPWTNEAQSVFVPLNDYTATIIGMIRDDLDFRTVLSDNILYVGGSTSPAYQTNSNAHYEAIENNGADLKTELSRTTQTGIPAGATAGVMTTRAASRAFFVDGTNRAMLRFTMMNHLCKDMEQVKDITRAPDRIRQDVSRSPGGDSRIFMNSCIGCHAGMDPLAQAFAYYEWTYPTNNPDAGQLTYDTTSRPVDINDTSKGTTRAQPKNLINSSNFEYGYVTRDDSWVNYWREGPNAVLGWSGPQANGQGARTMGVELANSEAFTSCQVRKAFETVCFRDPMNSAADRTKINQIVAGIGTGSVNMKQIFAETASYCKDGSAY
jgi:hypothetical protein